MKAALHFPVPLKLGEGHQGMFVEHLLYVRHWAGISICGLTQFLQPPCERKLV